MARSILPKIDPNSIKIKLGLVILSGVSLTVFILIWFAYSLAKERAVEFAEKNIYAEARDFRGRIATEMNRAMDAARTMAQTFATIPDRSATFSLTREEANSMLTSVLAANPNFYSVYTCWEPNAFDGKDAEHKGTPNHDETGRYIPGFSRTIENLIVLEPLESYKVQNELSTWYYETKELMHERIDEPNEYKDVYGNRILVTGMNVPVVHKSRFYGMVGVDLTIQFFQSLAEQTSIFDGSARISIVSNQGKVVAVSDAPLLVGKDLKFLYDNPAERLEMIQRRVQSVEYDDRYLSIYIPLEVGRADKAWQVSVRVPLERIYGQARDGLGRIVLLGLVVGLLALAAIFLFVYRMTTPLAGITQKARQMALGRLEGLGVKASGDEVGQVNQAIDTLREGLLKTSAFANAIGSGNLEAEFEPMSEQDALGNALLRMRSSLQQARAIEASQKRETELRSWISEGAAKFADLLRQNSHSTKALSYAVVSKLVEYLGADQGGVFILVDEPGQEHPHLEMTAAYAFNRQKHLKRSVLLGEGLVGTCAEEGKSIFMTEVPEDYIDLTSGLGQARPRCLFIVPLKTEKTVVGILELASLKILSPSERQFVEDIADDIAATIESTKINQQTALLLERSNQQAEAMRAQEEEMRQNLEELQATQEEAARREGQVQALIQALNSSSYTMEYDTLGTIIDLNDPYANLFGKPKEHIVGLHHWDGIDRDEQPGNDIDAFWNDLRNGISKKQINRYEFNGRAVWLSESYTPIFNEGGSVVRVLKIAYDISETKTQQIKLNEQKNKLEQTERMLVGNLRKLKEVQEQMRQKQIEMQGLIDAVDKAIIAAQYDHEGSILHVNNQFCDYAGVSHDRIVGHNIFELEAGHELERLRAIWERVLNGETVRGEMRRRVSHTAEGWFLATYTPTFGTDGKVKTVFYLAQDISESKDLEIKMQEKNLLLRHSEEELLRNLQKLEAVQGAMQRKQSEMATILDAISPQAGISELLPDGTISQTNDTLRAIFDIDPERMPGTLGQAGVFDGPEQAEAFWEAMRQGQTRRAERSLVVPSRGIVWLSEIFSPVLDEKGHLAKVITFSFDITRDKLQRAELEANAKALASKEKDLLRKVSELQHAQEELKLSRAESEQVIAAVNPMAGIIELDGHGRIMGANATLLALLGADPDELLGQDLEILLQHREPDDRAEVSRLAREAHFTALIQDFSLRGSTFWLSGSWNLLPALPGREGHTMFLGVDVTPLREQSIEQARLRQEQALWQQQVGQHLAQTKEQAKGLKKK